MKTISSAVSNFVSMTCVGAALTSTIVIATYKAFNALQSYLAPFEQSALWELACYVPIILFCYWALSGKFKNARPARKIASESTVLQSDDLIQNILSRFTLGFLEGYEAQALKQQTTQENKNETNNSLDSTHPHNFMRSPS